MAFLENGGGSDKPALPDNSSSPSFTHSFNRSLLSSYHVQAPFWVLGESQERNRPKSEFLSLEQVTVSPRVWFPDPLGQASPPAAPLTFHLWFRSAVRQMLGLLSLRRAMGLVSPWMSCLASPWSQMRPDIAKAASTSAVALTPRANKAPQLSRNPAGMPQVPYSIQSKLTCPGPFPSGGPWESMGLKGLMKQSSTHSRWSPQRCTLPLSVPPKPCP